MFVIKHRKFFYIFTLTLLAASLASVLFFGLKLGLDFTGGSLLEVEYLNKRPEIPGLEERFLLLGYSGAKFQPASEKGLIVRLRDLTEEEHGIVMRALAEGGEPPQVLIEKRFDSVGPTIGSELKRNSLIAILLVISLILIFISWTFRKVSRPVSSWKYGLVAIIALAHDIFIPTGLFAFLGWFAGAEIDSLFVTALLTILGFSVHDTIVVFDRIRENLRKASGGENFEDTIGRSLDETMGRSLATSFALFLVLAALFWFGASITRYFALTLLVGVIAGTYSSIFLASPLVVTWQKWHSRKGN